MTEMTRNANGGAECPLCGHSAARHLLLVHTTVWRCAAPDCGLAFAVPQLDEEALARFYADLYYPANGNGREVRFENTPDSILRQVFQKLESRFDSLGGLRLLDYGCGRGPLLRVSLEFGMQPAGIEQDPEARAVAAKIPGAAVYQSIDDLQNAEAGAQFDLITLWTVVEHLRNPWADLARLRALLCPGGWMLISTMDIRCLRARIEREHWENYENPTHLYYFDRISLARAIRAAGFSEFSEWKVKISYAHHGFVRRWLYRIVFALGLADGLFYLCKRIGQVERTEDTTSGVNHASAQPDQRPEDSKRFRVGPLT